METFFCRGCEKEQEKGSEEYWAPMYGYVEGTLYKTAFRICFDCHTKGVTFKERESTT